MKPLGLDRRHVGANTRPAVRSRTGRPGSSLWQNNIRIEAVLIARPEGAPGLPAGASTFRC